MKYEHDIRAIRRVDGNISYWIAKSRQLPGCLGRGSSVEEAIQNLIDPKGNTNGAKGLSDYTLRSLRIEDESDSEKRQGLAEKLQDPSVFCGDCKNYGEPNGCNRDGGYCVAWDSHRTLRTFSAEWSNEGQRGPQQGVQKGNSPCCGPLFAFSVENRRKTWLTR